jgi:hypothetical protein
VFGRLATDRPHSWKGETSYDFKWGTSIGAQYILESGTPLQTQMSEKAIPFFPFGRGDLGRTPVYHQANLLVQHDIRVSAGRRVNVNVNVLNLFDEDIATAYTLTPYRDSFNISDAAFFAGFDPVALARSTAGIRPDARFNLPSAFQSRRSIQLNVRYAF